MKMLTKDVDYAIRALIYITANKNNYFPAKEIAEKNKIPYEFLKKILKKLTKENIIKTKEGVNGGVKLLTNPSTITVSKLIQIFQGEIELNDCMFRHKICENRKTCVLRKEIKNIETKLTKEFNKISIQKLVNKLETK